MKVALAQMQMSDDMTQNLKKSLSLMLKAAQNQCDLICFPEIQLTKFFPQYPGRDAGHLALSLDHEYIRDIQSAAGESHLVTVPNIYLKSGSAIYDASPVINNDGQLLGVSKMVHIVQWPLFYEQDYYEPSDDGFIVYDTAAGKIGVVICFDRHYPESMRTCAIKGAQLIVIPTAIIKGEPLTEFEWELRLAAKHNGVFIALCNRVGSEDQMHFTGHSMIIAPDGEIIARAGMTETLLMADLDYSRIEKSRKERPYLALRRPEMYL
jgi:predicted amidohydrolase